MSATAIMQEVVAMIIFALLAKVAGHALRKVQLMPAAKKYSLGIGAAILANVAMNGIALFISVRALRNVLDSQEQITRVDMFAISFFTLCAFQLCYAILFGEAVRTRLPR